MLVDSTADPVYIGLGNDLVPSDNKPLSGPMLTQICVAICGHLVKIC